MPQFGVLGSLTVHHAGEALVVPSGRARVLLGALIVHPGAAHSVDELVDLVWGEAPPRTAVTALHGHVSRLRKALGDATLRTTPGGYLLAVGADQVDSGRFRAMVVRAQREKDADARCVLLREALGLWRGRALADFCYEPFAQPEIAVLEEMRVTAIEDAVEADLAVGRHGVLIGELQALVRSHPLRERLWAHLMIALYRAGRQAEALAAFRVARQRMADELGVDPGPALRELETAILRHDAALVAPIPMYEQKLARSDAPIVRRAGRADAEFVGRSAELGRLHAILGRVTTERRPALLTVVGEPGVGKSRLSGEFVCGVRDRVTLLAGQCEPDVEATYAPLHQLLAQVRAGADDPARHLLAGLEEALDGGTAVEGRVIDAAATRLFASLAARRPVVLVLEDIHWAQPALLDLLEAVSANAGAAVMTLCLARPELAGVRPSFGSGAPGAVTVGLGPLSPAEVRRMVLDVAEAGASAGAVDEIVSVAQGNPFFAMQLVAWAGEAAGSPWPLPPAVRTLLANRIGGLGPGELAVVQCAAIAGRDFSLDAVTALRPTDARPTVARHLGALQRRQLVQPTSHGYQFRHHLIHRTAYVAMDPGIRARLHEQYADWLTAGGGVGPASADETIGYHLERAHGDLRALGTRDEHAARLGVRAATHLAAAGRRAYSRFDGSGAASLMTRALRLLPHGDPQRPQLLLDASRFLRSAGRTQEAVTTLLETIDRAQDAGDVVVQWRARLELSFLRGCVVMSDRAGEEALRVAGQAVAALTPLRDDEGLAFAWLQIGQAREALGELTRAGTAYRRARRHAQLTPGRSSGGTIAWGLAAVLLDGPTPVPAAITRCRELVDWKGHPIAVVMLPLAELHALHGDLAQARAVLAQAAWMIREWSTRRPPLFLALTGARVELAAGQFEKAEQYSRQGLELGASLGGDEADIANALVLAQSLCRQGRIDEADGVLATYASVASGQDAGQAATWNAVRAELRAHHRAWADAVELASRAVASVDRTGLFNLRAELRLTLAAALRGAGDAAGASRAATQALRLFEAKGNNAGLARARDLLARVAPPTAEDAEERPRPGKAAGRRPR